MKPKQFHRVNPFLPVRNLQETLDYYRDVLGFTDEWIMPPFDGGIRRDTMRLIFRWDPDYVTTINTPEWWFILIWFVDNVDDIFREYQERGIEIMSPIEDKPWHVREFSIRDINGYQIRISESIS